MEYFKFADVQIKCVKEKCNGLVDAMISNSCGNFEGECGDCGAQVGFHCEIEIDGVYDNTDYDI